MAGWSAEATRLLGWTAPEAIGKSWLKLAVSSESHPAMSEQLRLERGEEEAPSPSSPLEITVVHRDGRILRVDLLVSTLHWGEESGFGLSIYQDQTLPQRLVQDLQEAHLEMERTVERRSSELLRKSQELEEQIAVRKESEDALRHSESSLQMLLTQLPAVLWTTDTQLRFTSLMGAGLNTLTIRPEHVMGRTMAEIMGPGEAGIRTLECHRQALEGRPASYVILVKDLYFNSHVEPLRNAQGGIIGVIGVSLNDTERLRAENALRQAHEELEQKVAERTADLARAADETRLAYLNLKSTQDQLVRSEKLASIGMLVSGVAHEINNPLNVILGNLKLLTEKDGMGRIFRARSTSLAPGESRRIRSMLGDATRAAERTRTIIETFRSFARDTRTAEEVDLNACVEETLRIVERQLPTGVRLKKRLGRIPRVQCFRGQLNQVFFNLVQNAVEAIEGKGTVQICSRKEKGAVVIEVQDSGRGMSPELQARVFEPFFTTKPVGKGLGLGLSISAMIVQNHGGAITIDSQVGIGTTFRVMLPIEATAGRSDPDP